MKLERNLFLLATVCALSLAGCSKENSAPSPTSQDAQKATSPAADTLKQTADSVKTAAQTAVTETTTQAKEAAATATNKAQEWIDKAKSLVADGKFSEAASALQQLTGLQITDEQQKLATSLKEQIQKALAAKAATDGASSVGGLLKK